MSVPTNPFEPFDVVVVPFPYADRLAEKRRPAIIVSGSNLTERYGLVWLAMVTSAENKRWESDIDVGDLRKAGLPAASFIRPAKIATADAARVLKRIGHLSAKDIRLLKQNMLALLAF